MVLMVLPVSWATIKLNSSKSNAFRIVFSADVVSQAQGDAMVKELDKLGPSDEAKLKQWLAANFKRFGIDGTRIKLIRVQLQQKVRCDVPATTCKGKFVGPGLAQQPAEGTTVKGSKSNSDNRLSGVCLCFESITTPAQVRRVNRKDSFVTIFLLSDPTQEPAAFHWWSERANTVS